jgi:hypothetical protein
MVLAAAVLSMAALPAGAHAATPWSIGAAKVDTTPPLFNSAQDLQDFPEAACPRAVYDGPRAWRFEEPYQDTDDSGDFNYPEQGGVRTPEPYCDFNHNGRWEGIYLSGGTDQHAVPSPNPIPGYSGPGHDPIDARAVAFSDGSKTVVLVSVVAQGIFENYVREARTLAQTLAGQGAHQASCGHIDEMVVSSNHNESSPDTIGLYGAPPDPTGTIGLNSGIDEYYMDWLDEQMANAAVEACDNRQPASLHEVEFPVPDDLEQEIPNRFPTTDDFGDPAAIDPKVRVLQARDTTGDPIFTMMNLAAHNQDIGQSDTFEESHTTSSDWPGYFHRRLEQNVGGMAMFMAADIGSMEDLITVPRIPDPPCNNGANGCYAQVELTGNRIADKVTAALANTSTVPLGTVGGERNEFCAPIENNLFKAAASAGIFGERQAYTGTADNCAPSGRSGSHVKTSVAVLDVGPDLQFIVNPGEAFPGLMLGTPWGIEDASCPTAPNPLVPTWRARAKHRFQVGLGDDLIGYEKQAWSFDFASGTFSPMYGCSSDPHNHHHGLEDEALGPSASNMVANRLSKLLDQKPDPIARIRLGRYVKADGSLTDAYSAPDDQGAPGHFPTDAVAVWLANPGTTSLNAQPGQPDSGTIVALDSVGSFGNRAVDENGDFMDFDGAGLPGGPDVTTRGMRVKATNGRVQRRYYVNVYPALTVSGSLGPTKSHKCGNLAATIVGTSAGEPLTGTPGDDVIVGLGGNDTISGLGGNDKICGGDGNDTLNGGDGSDTFIGGAGADRFNGGTGGDTASYADRTLGVTVTLDGVANDGNSTDQSGALKDNAGTDVEDVVGGKGADTLTGSAVHNVLRGGEGADVMSGLGGVDAVAYDFRTAGVTVDIDGVADDGNSADGPVGARDNVQTDIEDLIGGKGADTLTGNEKNNGLSGGPGADILRGLGARDILFANDGTADTTLDCDGGTADRAHVDAQDPPTIGCESVGP